MIEKTTLIKELASYVGKIKRVIGRMQRGRVRLTVQGEKATVRIEMTSRGKYYKVRACEG